jgi:hypothetical protein
MKNLSKYTLLAIFMAMIMPGSAQDEDQPKLVLGGYVKYLQSNTYVDVATFKSLTTSNLIHNRLNFKWYPTSRLTLSLEARNRLFWGEDVKNNPNYGQQVNVYNGLVEASILWIDSSDLVLHSILDRAYIEYATDKWELRLGRQRINWGINTVWNPNDLFNAFNYLDFDYEERPGSDALRFTYYTGLLSSVEVAFSPARDLEKSVAAALYRFNLKNYDVQLMSGYYQGDIAIGGGWSGYIGGAGFKGETTYFIPTDQSEDSLNTFSISVAGDYQLGKFYLMGSVYYGSRGVDEIDILGLQTGLIGGQLSAKNLYPTKWAFFANASTQLSPLSSLSLGAIYSPNGHLLTGIPTITYSIKENWDLDLIGQLFLLEYQEKFKNFVDGVYLRMKWSF